ncbi:MAG: AAA family ATPase [Haloechinothrix sp.]
MADALVPRRITDHADEFLDSFRILIINGPRQAGKTTLLQQLNEARSGSYLTLDDVALRAAAQADPEVFISGSSSLPDRPASCPRHH